MLGWLTERQVEVVVMEATADYWRGVYYLLQPQLNLALPPRPGGLTNLQVMQGG
ncbi:hypothetical protein ACFC09_44165 [Streptomyces sp. NPDC056161]|uniref:hypothetical protein n=1 Tax=Streptomyces sp. NPDC056161 TaxID=3345732 RepID=UPI0035D6B5A1